MTGSQPVDAVGSAIGTDTLPLHLESTLPHMTATKAMKLSCAVFVSGFGIPGPGYPNL